MLIEELRIRGIKFIVAPYEADAQLAYLSRNGIVDVLITEDSDLLVFGAKRILYKLDFSTMSG
jgi:exonuclease-1